MLNRHKGWIVVIVLGLASTLLGGCMASVPAGTIPDFYTPPPTPDGGPIPDATATPVPPTPVSDPALPGVLLTQETDAGSLYLIRYEGGQGVCVALTFDTQTLAVNHCGLTPGQGVGFVDSLTAPDGRVARVAYGLAPSEGVTAVAIEFSGGGNVPATVNSGGYVLVLGSGQTPRRATAIDQFGYMAGQWGF